MPTRTAHPTEPTDTVTAADDVCALSLARRMAALLDRDPATLAAGAPLPRGWHTLLFNPPTPQAALREDGAAGLGARLPDLGLPRLMLGGRAVQFLGDIPIGSPVRRETRRLSVEEKSGRSGRFAVVRIEHRVFVDRAPDPVLVERQDYLLREAPSAGPDRAKASQLAAPVAAPAAADAPHAVRRLLPDETLLFRYSAITDNPHRIHYDLAYARDVEGYPALVVNGSIPGLFLLELFRAATGREPRAIDSRNVAPMYCGRPLQLHLRHEADHWRLWAVDDTGRTTWDARAT